VENGRENLMIVVALGELAPQARTLSNQHIHLKIMAARHITARNILVSCWKLSDQSHNLKPALAHTAYYYIKPKLLILFMLGYYIMYL